MFVIASYACRSILCYFFVSFFVNFYRRIWSYSILVWEKLDHIIVIFEYRYLVFSFRNLTMHDCKSAAINLKKTKLNLLCMHP